MSLNFTLGETHSMSFELSEPRLKNSFKQDAAFRYCKVNLANDSSSHITTSLVICRTLVEMLLTVIPSTHRHSPLLASSPMFSLVAQGHGIQL